MISNTTTESYIEICVVECAVLNDLLDVKSKLLERNSNHLIPKKCTSVLNVSRNNADHE